MRHWRQRACRFFCFVFLFVQRFAPIGCAAATPHACQSTCVHTPSPFSSSHHRPPSPSSFFLLHHPVPFLSCSLIGFSSLVLPLTVPLLLMFEFTARFFLRSILVRASPSQSTRACQSHFRYRKTKSAVHTSHDAHVLRVCVGGLVVLTLLVCMCR